MQVILLERIANLGSIGEKVKVKNGYCRNYLIPNKKALPYSEENFAIFEKLKEKLLDQESKRTTDAQSVAVALEGLAVVVNSLANSEGKLFGSIGTTIISSAVNKLGFSIGRSQVLMPNGPIREVGIFPISIRLHLDIISTIQLTVKAEES
ncbi:MAG: 50S ribosomal protein L9 [Methylacidiphilales bacterium]|nr:50S ribosomal protein L9 [Candidatus Methylacidiphilales bacterium]